MVQNPTFQWAGETDLEGQFLDEGDEVADDRPQQYDAIDLRRGVLCRPEGQASGEESPMMVAGPTPRCLCALQRPTTARAEKSLHLAEVSPKPRASMVMTR